MLLANLLGDGKELTPKAFVHVKGGFAHASKHTVGTMLGSNLELTADVVTYQLAKEIILFVKHQIVKANAASNKDLFYARYRFCLLDELGVFGVIDLQVFARCGRKTLAIGANAMLKLTVAGGVAEICGRAAGDQRG